MLEPGIIGHLSYEASFPFSHKWPVKTGATVCGVLNKKVNQTFTVGKLLKHLYENVKHS